MAHLTDAQNGYLLTLLESVSGQAKRTADTRLNRIAGYLEGLLAQMQMSAPPPPGGQKEDGRG